MANELREWYANFASSYGLIPLPKSGHVRPFYMGEHDGRYNDTACILYTKGGQKKAINYKMPELMENARFFVPECKMFNGSKQAAYYTLSPNRQYCKGLRDMSFNWVGSTGAVNVPRFLSDVELAWGWNREYPGFEEALEEILAGRMFSCAFDKYWAIGIAYGIDFPVLYYKREPVGVLNDKNILELEATYGMFSEFLSKRMQREIARV